MSDKRTLKRARTLKNYSSKSKYDAVSRWRLRIAKNRNLTLKMIASSINKPSSRLCEYMSFYIEPPEDIFNQIEKILYDHGV